MDKGTLEYLLGQVGCHLDEASQDAARLRCLDSHFFRDGQRVTLVGLGGRADLNGKGGCIQGARPTRSDGGVRYPVVVDGEGAKPMGLQPINLRLSIQS